MRVRLQDCKRKPAVARLTHSAPIGHRTPGPSGDNNICATPTNWFGGSYAPSDNFNYCFRVLLIPNSTVSPCLSCALQYKILYNCKEREFDRLIIGYSTKYNEEKCYFINWRASIASETLTGVTQSKIEDVSLFIYLFIIERAKRARYY